MPMLSFRNITEHFGAEVDGVDLTQPLADGVLGEIRDAFDEYSVLVFHEQPFDDETQIKFSLNFGPLEKMRKTKPGGGKHISDITNIDPATNEMYPADHWRLLYNKGNEMWHSDSSFKPAPSLASMLSGRIVPPEGAGTEFASQRAAYAAMTPVEQARLDGLVAVHSFEYSRNIIDKDMLTDAMRAEHPPIKHALVRANPANGRKAFYSGAHASHIEGMAEAEGRAMLRELVELATQPQFTYLHKWAANDFVIWDNRCMLHRGRPWAVTEYPRVMHRTTVAGAGPTVSEDGEALSAA
jgi:alpha-ketoglutarate-dependent 2,4-dichlorophenoxyacetate dioxygenase